LAFLREVAAGCQRCPLALHRTKVVFGTGPAAARLLLLGEAPGSEEDRAGTPFVGRSGHALDRLLSEAGLNRAEAYVTNAAMCRPTLHPAPRPAEIEACAPYLDLELAVVRPQVIVAFGGTATRRLLGASGRLETLRGKVHPLERASVIPTWHPSSWNRQAERRAQALGDLKIARFLLDRRPEVATMESEPPAGVLRSDARR
jgi:DNA polymerase